MELGYEKLDGIDRDRVLSIVEPVLRAHRVDAVELIWRSDSRGWVLYLTVEIPRSTNPGEGVTLDLCADISRDLSAALDVADVIPGKYRLDVGSPGLERKLYDLRDYERFQGHPVKVRLEQPMDGETMLRGTLLGVDESDRVVLEANGAERHVDVAQIRAAQLVFEWGPKTNGNRGFKSGRRRRAKSKRASQRNR